MAGPSLQLGNLKEKCGNKNMGLKYSMEELNCDKENKQLVSFGVGNLSSWLEWTMNAASQAVGEQW